MLGTGKQELGAISTDRSWQALYGAIDIVYAMAGEPLHALLRFPWSSGAELYERLT